jgi:hypothetical protein
VFWCPPAEIASAFRALIDLNREGFPGLQEVTLREFATLTLLLTGLSLQAQTPASPIPVPTIRANTRMILVSVIATNMAGPVTDLTAEECSVFENASCVRL